MMHRMPLRTRLALAIFALATLALVLVSASVYVLFQQSLRANIDDSLIARAGDELPSVSAGSVKTDGESDAILRVYSIDGTVAADSSPRLPPTNAERNLVDDALRAGQALATIQYPDGRYRVLAQSTNGPNGEQSILVSGLPFEQVSNPLRELRTLLLIAVPAAAALLAAASFFIARRSLAPVSSITSAARAIAGGDLSRRLAVESTDELGTLAATFNTMLARLQQTILRERRFASDASHQLRTPLTALESAVDVTLSRERGAPEYRTALEAVGAQLSKLDQLVSRLLFLARAEDASARAEFERVRIDGVIEGLVEEFSERHPLAGITLTSSGRVTVRGDLEMLAVAFDNLLENAVQHGGPDVSVTIVLSAVEDESIVQLTDDGPGIPTEMVPVLFERFRRGPQSRGSGLGLSIVQSVVALHGGSIELAHVKEGVSFKVRLPREKDESSSSPAQVGVEGSPSKTLGGSQL